MMLVEWDGGEQQQLVHGAANIVRWWKEGRNGLFVVEYGYDMMKLPRSLPNRASVSIM